MTGVFLLTPIKTNAYFAISRSLASEGLRLVRNLEHMPSRSLTSSMIPHAIRERDRRSWFLVHFLLSQTIRADCSCARRRQSSHTTLLLVDYNIGHLISKPSRLMRQTRPADAALANHRILNACAPLGVYGIIPAATALPPLPTISPHSHARSCMKSAPVVRIRLRERRYARHG